MNLLPMFANPFETGVWPLALFFGVAIFFLLREVVAWYWKINKIIILLEKIEENTRPKGWKNPDDEDL